MFSTAYFVTGCRRAAQSTLSSSARFKSMLRKGSSVLQNKELSDEMRSFSSAHLRVAAAAHEAAANKGGNESPCFVEQTEGNIAVLEATLQIGTKENRHKVLNHGLYQHMRATAVDEKEMSKLVRIFMEHHVWAVWDYFQILKRLQGDLTCTNLPWRPKGDRQLRRFINEIVAEEESDVFEDMKTPGSHLELYLRGMLQAGANTAPMENFLKMLESNEEDLDPKFLATKAREFGAPEAAVDHIFNTMGYAYDRTAQASDAMVAAIFAFGREDIIPSMFTGILDEDLAKQFSIFKFYLERHIELDGNDHGPLALRLVRIVCGSDAQKWHKSTEAVNHALDKRFMLWQSVLNKHKAILMSNVDQPPELTL